jgi:hypothetical protein
LNVSSRGLLINASAVATSQGSTIELWHGDHLIVATVVWRKGTRAGLRAEDKIAVDQILALSKGSSAQLTAGEWPYAERRKKPRSAGESRIRARATQFASLSVIAASLAAIALAVVLEAFAQPMAAVTAALNG